MIGGKDTATRTYEGDSRGVKDCQAPEARRRLTCWRNRSAELELQNNWLMVNSSQHLKHCLMWHPWCSNHISQHVSFTLPSSFAQLLGDLAWHVPCCSHLYWLVHAALPVWNVLLHQVIPWILNIFQDKPSLPYLWNHRQGMVNCPNFPEVYHYQNVLSRFL